MSRPQRVVLDNNVVVSRMLFPLGTAASVFDLCFASCVLLTSAAALGELYAVIERSKFDRYLQVEERREFARRYAAGTITPRIAEVITECRDPKDNHVLELALAGNADVIITGDADLLSLNPWREIAILSPSGLLARVT